MDARRAEVLLALLNTRSIQIERNIINTNTNTNKTNRKSSQGNTTRPNGRSKGQLKKLEVAVFAKAATTRSPRSDSPRSEGATIQPEVGPECTHMVVPADSVRRIIDQSVLPCDQAESTDRSVESRCASPDPHSTTLLLHISAVIVCNAKNKDIVAGIHERRIVVELPIDEGTFEQSIIKATTLDQPVDAAALSNLVRHAIHRTLASCTIEHLEGQISRLCDVKRSYLFRDDQVLYNSETVHEIWNTTVVKGVIVDTAYAAATLAALASGTTSGSAEDHLSVARRLLLAAFLPTLRVICVPLSDDAASCKCNGCQDLQRQSATTVVRLSKRKIRNLWAAIRVELTGIDQKRHAKVYERLRTETELEQAAECTTPATGEVSVAIEGSSICSCHSHSDASPESATSISESVSSDLHAEGQLSSFSYEEELSTEIFALMRAGSEYAGSGIQTVNEPSHPDQPRSPVLIPSSPISQHPTPPLLLPSACTTVRRVHHRRYIDLTATRTSFFHTSDNRNSSTQAPQQTQTRTGVTILTLLGQLILPEPIEAHDAPCTREISNRLESVDHADKPICDELAASGSNDLEPVIAVDEDTNVSADATAASFSELKPEAWVAPDAPCSAEPLKQPAKSTVAIIDQRSAAPKPQWPHPANVPTQAKKSVAVNQSGRFTASAVSKSAIHPAPFVTKVPDDRERQTHYPKREACISTAGQVKAFPRAAPTSRLPYSAVVSGCHKVKSATAMPAINIAANRLDAVPAESDLRQQYESFRQRLLQDVLVSLHRSEQRQAEESHDLRQQMNHLVHAMQQQQQTMLSMLQVISQLTNKQTQIQAQPRTVGAMRTCKPQTSNQCSTPCWQSFLANQYVANNDSSNIDAPVSAVRGASGWNDSHATVGQHQAQSHLIVSSHPCTDLPSCDCSHHHHLLDHPASTSSESTCPGDEDSSGWSFCLNDYPSAEHDAWFHQLLVDEPYSATREAHRNAIRREPSSCTRCDASANTYSLFNRPVV